MKRRAVRRNVGNYLGLDPGEKGGWAVLAPDGSLISAGDWAGKTPLEALVRMRGVLQASASMGLAIAGVERLRPFSRGGIADGEEKARKVAPISVFGMGRARGHLEAFLVAEAIRWTDVEPKWWQRELGSPKGNRREIKRVSVEWARKRWPLVPISKRVTAESGIADACWIAEWTRKEYPPHRLANLSA